MKTLLEPEALTKTRQLSPKETHPIPDWGIIYPSFTAASRNLVRFCRHMPHEQLAECFATDFAFRAEYSRFSVLKNYGTLPGPDECFSHIQMDARPLFTKLLGMELEYPGGNIPLLPYSSMNFYRSHIEEFFHHTVPTCKPGPPVQGRCFIHFASTDVLHIRYELRNTSQADIDLRLRFFSKPAEGIAHSLEYLEDGFRHSCRQHVFREYNASATLTGCAFHETDGRLETAWEDVCLGGGKRQTWEFQICFDEEENGSAPLSIQDAVNKMEGYYAALPELPSHLKCYEHLALRAAGIVQSNRYMERDLQGRRIPVLHGGKAGVEALWFWDTCTTVLGSALMKDEEVGWNSLRMLCEGIAEDGTPFARYHVGQYEVGAQNPILAWGVWNFHSLCPDPDALATCYPALQRYVNWWLGKWTQPGGLCSFAEGEGCLGLDDALSTMMDCPIALSPGEKWYEKSWGQKRESRFETPDLNAHLYLEMKALGLIARTLGRAEQAEAWEERAERFGQILHERLFNPEAGIYQARRTEDGKFSGLVSAESFLPIYAGITPRPIAQKMCRDYLLNPDHFYTLLPFPTLDRSHEAFRSSGSLYEPPAFPGAVVQQSYWQGRAWLNYNYFMVGALNQAGLTAEADAAALKILDVVSRHESLYECYDPLTGTGTGHAEFPWAGASALALLHGLYRNGPLGPDPLEPPVRGKNGT